MKNYEKPMVMVNEGLAEGVYAASGDCWKNLQAEITDYNTSPGPQVSVSMKHVNEDMHLSSITMTLYFNQTITAATGSGWNRTPDYLGESGSTVVIQVNIGTSNPNEELGGNVIVECENPAALLLTDFKWSCDGI